MSRYTLFLDALKKSIPLAKGGTRQLATTPVKFSTNFPVNHFTSHVSKNFALRFHQFFQNVTLPPRIDKIDEVRPIFEECLKDAAIYDGCNYSASILKLMQEWPNNQIDVVTVEGLKNLMIEPYPKVDLNLNYNTIEEYNNYRTQHALGIIFMVSLVRALTKNEYYQAAENSGVAKVMAILKGHNSQYLHSDDVGEDEGSASKRIEYQILKGITGYDHVKTAILPAATIFNHPVISDDSRAILQMPIFYHSNNGIMPSEEIARKQTILFPIFFIAGGKLNILYDSAKGYKSFFSYDSLKKIPEYKADEALEQLNQAIDQLHKERKAIYVALNDDTAVMFHHAGSLHARINEKEELLAKGQLSLDNSYEEFQRLIFRIPFIKPQIENPTYIAKPQMSEKVFASSLKTPPGFDQYGRPI